MTYSKSRCGYGNRYRFMVDVTFLFCTRISFFSMDGHPEAPVVLFPCSVSQGLKEASLGITLRIGFISSCLAFMLRGI
jgi:hypothetical protein